MIKKVTLRFFKHFKNETFDLADSIILAGPNNTGKTTLLQAITVWNLALQKWLSERGPGSGSTAEKRTGVAITRKDFTAIPLREMNLLWTDRSTTLNKEELSDKKPGTPRKLEIELLGDNDGNDWRLCFKFIYRYPDMVHVKPSEDTPIQPHLPILQNINVVHVPPFSGIGSEETRFDKAYQALLIGQGKPGDIIRNLLLELNRKIDGGEWKELCKNINDIFHYDLLDPVYNGQPFILCEYKSSLPGKSSLKLDISCAGSGFLQVLMLLGFFYARPASINWSRGLVRS